MQSTWRVDWGSVWVGALAALVSTLIFGLLATALGAQWAKSGVSWHDVPRAEVAAVIATSFFAFVIGGWCAARCAGLRVSEPAILHAAIAWLLSTPLLLLALAGGAAHALGGWYGGLIVPLGSAATSAAPDPDTVRNAAVGALTALLVGLIGSVIGGWIASGEPMSLTHHRTRDAALRAQKGS